MEKVLSLRTLDLEI